MEEQKFRYRVFSEWSDEDSCFVARVPVFPGLASHGDTMAEATEQAIVAGEAMLEVLKEQKKPVPESDTAADYSGQFRLRIRPSTHRRYAAMAKAEGVSLNSFVQTTLIRGEKVSVMRSGRDSPGMGSAFDDFLELVNSKKAVSKKVILVVKTGDSLREFFEGYIDSIRTNSSMVFIQQSDRADWVPIMRCDVLGWYSDVDGLMNQTAMDLNRSGCSPRWPRAGAGL